MSDAAEHNHGVTPECERCHGSGFIMLWDHDGPDLHDEDNCDCTEEVCDCEPCRARHASPGVADCEYCALRRKKIEVAVS
jgi:hypothetical protein